MIAETNAPKFLLDATFDLLYIYLYLCIYLFIIYIYIYRDDGQVLWDGTDEKHQELYNSVNTLNLDPKFKMEIGNQSIHFLDLRISITGDKLTTTVYSKPTYSNLYLDVDSCHNKSSINGIQKGVVLRLPRISTSDNDYTHKSKEYTKYLVNSGHDLKLV